MSENSCGYRMFYVFHRIFTKYGLISIWHFSSTPLRCDKVINSVRKEGLRERKLPDCICARVSAY